jgi:hypothetical protein
MAMTSKLRCQRSVARARGSFEEACSNDHDLAGCQAAEGAGGGRFRPPEHVDQDAGIDGDQRSGA